MVCFEPIWAPYSTPAGSPRRCWPLRDTDRSSTRVRLRSSATTGGSGYPAGKAAVNGLTLAISAELKARGVRANVICPGARTRLSSGPDYEAHINELHRRGLLDEMTRQASLDAPPADFVAPLYAYLASDLASGITGQIFVASGGFVGTFDRPTPRVLGWRDHRADPPWPVEDLHTMINARRLDTD
ncbi:2-keto-3-deoxy-L-fuconate dehydrogenase [Mycobacterium marinum]|nr:2-keto-3-deoxy-L-fuconate dehydrogenase [Mycobacterium marinum]RFZ01915.1 2-keto-3-deoxy-L-fuconate dehydrogenase [Mycobacterium marinum]